MIASTRLIHALLCLVLTSSAWASVQEIVVDASNPSCPGSGTPADPYCTIQAAIDAASNFDLIVVRPGTYLERIDFKGKAVTVRSTHGPGATIIDGQQQGTVVSFLSGEGSLSELAGFTVRGGLAGNVGGGGISCGANAYPIIRNNTITANVSPGNGGGIYCLYAFPYILNNTITGNSAGIWGGGISCYNFATAHIEGNRIFDNYAGSGGGISAVFADPEVRDNDITNNRVGFGGGGFYGNISAARLTANLVARNEAFLGGGVYLTSQFPGFPAITVLTNNTIAHNVGHGITTAGTYQTTEIVNSIVWGNSLGSVQNYGSTVLANYSDIELGYAGPGNLAADPLFLDAAQSDFRIDCASPCVDAGRLVIVPMPLFDREGRDLRQIGLLDLGSDEAGLQWSLSGAPQVGGAPIQFVARAPLNQNGLLAEVYLSLGAGTSGGLKVPGSLGRRIALDADALLATWLGLPPPLRQATLSGCNGSATLAFGIPASAPVGVTVHYAGVSWNLGAGAAISVSEVQSFTTQ